MFRQSVCCLDTRFPLRSREPGEWCVNTPSPTVPRAWGVVCQHAFAYGPASLGSGVSTRLRLRSREPGELCVNAPSPTVPRVWGVVCQHAFAYGPASLGSGVSTRLRL